jgi:uncharacterized protein (TIGR03437 family)
MAHFSTSNAVAWKRTAIADGGPYFQVRRSAFAKSDSLIPIDFDSDGKVDLLTCGNYFPHTLTKSPCRAFHNDGKGNFTDVSLQVLGPNPPMFETPSNFSVADFNGDGRADVFIFNSADCCGFPPTQVGLLLQTPDGRLQDVSATNLPQQRLNAGAGACGDIDGDGAVDIFLASGFFGVPQIYLNDGQGHFTMGDPSRLPPILRTNPGRLPVYVAKFVDMNRDGRLHLFLGTDGQWGSRPRDLLLLNDGHGFFTLAPDNALPTKCGGRWTTESNQVVDFDGDGWPDFNGDGTPDLAAVIVDCCNPAVLEAWLSSRKFTFTPDLIPTTPAGPFFLRGSVLNSASFTADALAPGELVTIFGRNFGPDSLALASPADGSFPTQLSGVRVLFNNAAAPIVYASSGVVSAIVPFSVVPKTRADVVIEYKGSQSQPVSIFVDRSAPGLFTSDGSGTGMAAVLNVDSVTGAVSLNSSQNAARRGGIIMAYITGAAQTDPPSADGAVANSAGALALPIEAGLDFFWTSEMPCKSNAGCVPVPVLYAGPAPGLVAGVTQINMRLPDNAPVGDHPLGISVGGVWNQYNVTVSIR